MNADQKIKIMAEGGRLLAKIRKQLAEMAKPGVTLLAIDQQAESLIRAAGGESAFQRVRGYKWSTCINVNNGVVHGIPSKYEIKAGDSVAIDVGMYYQGLNTDTSLTVLTGKPDPSKRKFLEVGRQALKKAISAAKAGNKVWHISRAIETTITDAGYSVVQGLTGHGVGTQLHMAPSIPCFAFGKLQDSPVLQVGQTLAIEVIYTMGKPDLITERDGWTISTRDGKMAGLFEETVAVTANGPLILTK